MNVPFLLFKYAQALILLFIISACSQKVEMALPEIDNLIVVTERESGLQNIHMEKEAVYASSDTHLKARLGQFDVDEAGRVYIADAQQHRVHVFEPNGWYKTYFGREGSGPGEFRAMGAVKFI